MPHAGNLPDFALFQRCLVGTWSNQNFGTDAEGHQAGGPQNPLSYNVMPLPQVSPPPPDQIDFPGYILKNFKYYETIRFNNDHNSTIPVPATAPNRGGRYSQIARALFYDQKVMFAEGPNNGMVVHVENGSWISLVSDKQPSLPYGTADTVPGEPTPEPAYQTLAKQISVPHGNSVLALGTFEEITPGAPEIPDIAPPYPSPDYLSVEPYETLRVTGNNYQNPSVDLTRHPNKPLELAISILQPKFFMHWCATTKPLIPGRDRFDEKGIVTNIPFEHRLANVVDYFSDYWLISNTGNNLADFKYLAYTQTILMDLIITGRKYRFPHTTCNVVTKNNP